MNAARKPDVAIVGGGIIGCAIAFFLAKAGVRPLVLERGQAGGEASSGAAGLLSAQVHTDEPGVLFDLKLASRALYQLLAAELLDRTEIDIEYRELGHLAPALTEEETEAIAKRVTWQAARGLPAATLTAKEARELEPGLTLDVRGAGWFPQDHHVNNTAVTQAFAGATIRLGGEVRTGCPVQDLIAEGERVVGVRAKDENILADTVVLCAGAWSGQFEKAVGTALPVFPAKGQIVVARKEAPVIRHVVYGAAGYVLPRATGEHLMGSTVEYVGFDKGVTLEGLTSIMEGLLHLVPSLGTAEMAASWGCLRPATPDGLPILGAVPSRPGLIIATGHFRNGILLAPITGKLIAELITQGETSICLEPFRPDRPFPPGPPPKY